MDLQGSPARMGGALSELFRDYLNPMTPGESVGRFLEASFDPDVQAPLLATLIESNPLYAQYLQKLDILQEKVEMWRSDFPEERGTEHLTQFIVALLGATATRSAILTIWLNRHAAQGLPRKEGVPFLVLPRVHLRFAFAISQYCDEKNLAHADLAYLGGFCFDWVAALMDRKGGPVKTERKFLDESWPDAVKAARIAYELASVPRNLALSRYAFSATLLTHLGRVLMAALHPKREGAYAYRDFLKECDGHGPKTDLARLLLEPRKFPITHAETAALVANLFPMLHPAEKAIRFQQEPYFLRKLHPDDFQLATLISSAMTLGRGSPAALSPQQKKDLREISIDETGIETAFKRATGKKEK